MKNSCKSKIYKHEIKPFGAQANVDSKFLLAESCPR